MSARSATSNMARRDGPSEPSPTGAELDRLARALAALLAAWWVGRGTPADGRRGAAGGGGGAAPQGRAG